MLPFGEIMLTDGSTKELTIFGFEYIQKGQTLNYSLLPFLVMISLINLITLTSIFLYKNRMMQIRMNVFNAIMQLGSVGIAFYYLNDVAKVMAADYKTGILIIFPIIAAILTFLAIRQIAKDEALVRSISRLRKK
jgi:hypothetical protein